MDGNGQQNSSDEQKPSFFQSWLSRSRLNQVSYDKYLPDYAQNVALFLRAALKRMLDQFVALEQVTSDPEAGINQVMRYEIANEPEVSPEMGVPSSLGPNNRSADELQIKQQELAEHKRRLAEKWTLATVEAAEEGTDSKTGSQSRVSQLFRQSARSALYRRSAIAGSVVALIVMGLAGIAWLLLQ